MNKKNKRIIASLFLAAFVLFICTGSLYSLVFANESDNGYDDPPRPPGAEKSSSIREYVLRGAGYFLNGYSDILLFLSTLELAELEGLRCEQVAEMINLAAADMENARAVYDALKHQADQTPYNPLVIHQLEVFDYSRFMEQNGLDPFVFKKVETYLSEGDVRGVYHYIYENLEEILEVLYRIRSAVNAETFPHIPDLWALNQICSETLLFGQYVANVFHEIK